MPPLAVSEPRKMRRLAGRAARAPLSRDGADDFAAAALPHGHRRRCADARSHGGEIGIALYFVSLVAWATPRTRLPATLIAPPRV